MTHERKSVQQIRTLSELVDRRRTRTSAGALLELSMLETEKMRLARELRRTTARCKEIEDRMAEINTKQVRLKQFVDEPTAAAARDADIPRLPIHAAPPDGFKKRRLSY